MLTFKALVLAIIGAQRVVPSAQGKPIAQPLTATKLNTMFACMGGDLRGF